MKLQDDGRCRSWIADLDAFRSVPTDLAEATTGGAVMSLVAAATCLVLFICEAGAFFGAKPTTRIVVDSNTDPTLRINFDVHMLDMMCDHVTVGVWDAFGTDRMNITRGVMKQRIDHKGQRKGRPYTEDEITELEFSEKSFTQEELAELDSDWSSSSDSFKHDDFQSVVDAHDFTMVNFYAGWCVHCQQFAPTWRTFENSINSGNHSLKDADGVRANVRVLKINCVDFEDTCRSQKVHAFPTIRLYRRGAKAKEWAEYGGPRRMEALTAFADEEVRKRHLHMGATYHDMFTEGCRLSGYLEVARVPGTVHFQAVHPRDKDLNLAFTNVSHLVHHFSFGEAPRRSISALPAEYKRHVNPLDGRSFVASKFHHAPQHYIKVVHTRFEQTGLRSYQQTHQWSVQTLQRKLAPQAKFSYDLAPVEVVVSRGTRRWYDFVTSIFAIIGGAYSSMAILHGLLRLGAKHLAGLAKRTSH